MKKWSKKIAMLVLSFGMLIGSSVTAFAFVPDDVNSEAATETVQEETVAETPEENTKETGGDGFSVPGNGEVLDNITDDSSKEFYTITTANNNTYYLVIDHSTTSNNVYMLSAIDENDLKGFIEEPEETPETTPSVIVDEKPETPSVETEPEKAETETQTTEKGAMVAVILAALFGIGAYGYFKVYKPRQEDDDAESENMETEMFETINEDEEKTDEDTDLTDEE